MRVKGPLTAKLFINTNTMDTQLKGKTALVTGSTGGIGFAIARQLLAEGARVIINGRSQERIDQAIARLQETHPEADVTGVVADFAHAEEVAAITRQVPRVNSASPRLTASCAVLVMP